METKLTTNFTKGDGTPKIGFIIHGTLGAYEGAVNWLYQPCSQRNPVTYSSAHYVIAKDGRFTQLVKASDVAWHAGNIKNPTSEAQTVLPKNAVGIYKNPNLSFLGIELEWNVGDSVTEAQYQVIMEIIKNSGIINPIILCHKQIADYKADFSSIDGKIDLTAVNEVKRRLLLSSINTPNVETPTPSREDIKTEIRNLLAQL